MRVAGFGVKYLTKIAMASSTLTESVHGQNLISSNTEFALHLYKQLGQGNENSLFFSPLSISVALGMTMLGARNNTASEMKELLFKNIDEAHLHECAQELNAWLRSSSASGQYILHTANRLYVEETYQFLPEFLTCCQKYYTADTTGVNFKGDFEGARKMINQWVEKQTAKKITNLLPGGALDSLTRLVLVNAIYFKGDWERKFDKSKTTDGDFHVSETETVKVPMMKDCDQYKFGLHRQLDDTTVLELPYKGESLSMFILLPSKSLANLEAKLELNHLTNIEKEFRMRKSKTDVSIPRFKLEQDFMLVDTLKSMGIKDLFDENSADLSGIDGSKELYVGKVVHKAFINVDEEGSEAAAATAVVMLQRCMPRIMEFHVDKPFLFFIRDNKSQSILFLGRCMKPSC